MKRVYQPTIDQQTQELSEQVLKDLTQRPDNNMLIDKYRELKRELKESQARDAIKEFVEKVKELQEYKDWLALNLRKDEKRKKKKVPKDDLKRVAFYITQMKSSLPTVPRLSRNLLKSRKNRKTDSAGSCPGWDFT